MAEASTPLALGQYTLRTPGFDNSTSLFAGKGLVVLPAVSVGANLRLVITTSCLNHENMAPNGRPHAEMKRTAQHDQSAASLRRSRRSQSRVSFFAPSIRSQA